MTAAFPALIAAALSLGPNGPGMPARGLPPSADLLVLTGSQAVAHPPVFIPPAVVPRPGGGAAGGSDTPDSAAEASADERPLPAGVNATTTAAIVVTLNQATQFCSAFSQSEFVIDCLAERLDNVNRRMAGTSGYDDVRAALGDAALRLNRIARQNRSPARASATFRGTIPNGTRIETSRRLVPVDPARMDSALNQALAVIGEAETVLLRSAENSGDRAAQFQRIASAVGSNKVLLRSL
ncbi:MAG: hypothetical protein KDK02_02840 [Rhodobacteraceae bacterium]|nr:hypothetical protein [Paracoccaceae bacterium]